MAITRIVVYVSGHGFGHAIRIAEVIATLGRQRPNWHFDVRTRVSPDLFQGPAVQVHPLETGPGVAETAGTLAIDRDRTVRLVAQFLRNAEELVESEAAYVSKANATVIVADIPFLAGEISHRTGVPCVGIGNFTWDWVYEPYFEDQPRIHQANLDRIRDAYGKMQLFLRLPMSHDTRVFKSILDVGLVCRHSKKNRETTCGLLGVDVQDSKPLVFVGMRGQLPVKVLAEAAERSPDVNFVWLGQDSVKGLANVKDFIPNEDLTYTDVLAASDVVISKLGYGIIADCVANRTGILFPPRFGFREDELLRPAAFKYLRASEISLDDYESGRWSTRLGELIRSDAPGHSLATSGAEDCAKQIINIIEGD